MKYLILVLAMILLTFCPDFFSVQAQCSLCTKTAQQLGEKPALGMNQGILYLMLAPFAVIGIIAYRWWKNNREDGQETL